MNSTPVTASQTITEQTYIAAVYVCNVCMQHRLSHTHIFKIVTVIQDQSFETILFESGVIRLRSTGFV